MALERVPTDVVADDLIRTYRQATRRLEATVAAGLRRGLNPARLGTGEQRVGDATQAYRARQLAAARQITGELERLAPNVAPVVARRAYASTIFAVDRVTLGRGAGALDTRFGGVHQRAVAALAANMTGALERAAARAGDSVAAVFARADALEAGVPPQAFPFIGRRVDDPWRRVALDTVGEGLVTLETRRQVSAELYDRLLREGVTDATTGYVDRAGRRWTLDRYTEMVARTTTREATSRATVNRLAETGLELVTISSHPHAADECTPYDGATFALDGSHPDYETLDELPPFHPNCRHVVTPAGASLEEFERELGLAAESGVDVGDLETPVAPPAAPPAPAAAPRPAAAPAAPIGQAAQAADLAADAVSVRDLLKVSPKAKPVANPVLDSIDELHQFPGALAGNPIPVGVRKNLAGNAAGEYRYNSIIGPADIRINSRAKNPSEVAAHELGHYLDHGLGNARTKFASSDAPDLVDFNRAVDNSATVRELRAILASGRHEVTLVDGTKAVRPLSARARKQIEYLLGRDELFARAYAQYVWHRGGRRFNFDHGATLGGKRQQWDDDDFEAIADELDKFFAGRGLARPRRSPLARDPEPSHDRDTPARRESQDRVESWRLDPGEDPELAAARRGWQDADDAQARAFERARERADKDAIDEALGPDLVRILDDLAKSGYRDARLPELRQALVNGEVTIEEIEELAEAELKRRFAGQAERERAKAERGLRRRQINCFVCGQLKRRPADVCDRCGDDPVSYGGSAEEFNRAHGYGY